MNVERMMRLDGIHHVTGITGDGQRCLDFYSGILGLAFIGRDRDFEAPDSHLIRLGEEPGRPGGILSFIEAPRIGRGRSGNGMVHALSWIVRSSAALSYWADRLADAGIHVVEIEANGRGPRLRFADPDGIEHELTADSSGADRLRLGSTAIPSQHSIVALAGVRAYGRASVPSADILAGRLGFRVTGKDSYAVEGERRSSSFCFDPPPPERGHVGTGTIHHVAWAGDGELPAWRQRVIGMGCRATPVIERGHCHSIYFSEPSGVLFEIATSGERGSGASVPATDGRLLSPAVDPRVRAALVG
jgi:glyoxalase family protein